MTQPHLFEKHNRTVGGRGFGLRRTLVFAMGFCLLVAGHAFADGASGTLADALAALEAADWQTAENWVESRRPIWERESVVTVLPEVQAFVEALEKTADTPESYLLCAKTVEIGVRADFADTGTRPEVLKSLSRMMKRTFARLSPPYPAPGPKQWPSEIRLAAIASLEETKTLLQRRLQDRDYFSDGRLHPRPPTVPTDSQMLVLGIDWECRASEDEEYRAALRTFRAMDLEASLLSRERKALVDLQQFCDLHLMALDPARRPGVISPGVHESPD